MNYWYLLLIVGILGAVAVFLIDYKIQVGKEKERKGKLDKVSRFVDKIGSVYLFFFLLMVFLTTVSILIFLIYFGYSTGIWGNIRFLIFLDGCLMALIFFILVYTLRAGHLNFWRKERMR